MKSFIQYIKENYSQSAKGINVDFKRASQEVINHDIKKGSPEWKEFLNWFEKNNKSGIVSASELLSFLGH